MVIGIHLATQTNYLTGKVDIVPQHDGVVGEDGGGEVVSGVQSLGIHFAFKVAQTACLTGKVDIIPHHDGAVGEDGRGRSGVQCTAPWDPTCFQDCLDHLPDRESGQCPPP
jgi:hypothetical protein